MAIKSLSENRISELVEELVQHEKEMSVNYDHFAKVLRNFELSSEPFSIYYPIPRELNTPQESGNNKLTLDGILYNSRLAQVRQGLVDFKIKDQPKESKRFYEKVLTKLGIRDEKITPRYWNEYVLENLIKDDKILDILTSRHTLPYTLLARLDYVQDGEGKKMIYTRPVLVKPHASDFDESMIYQWEEKHITQKEFV